MAYASKFLVLLLMIFVLSAYVHAEKSDSSVIRILFVGNSLTYYNDVPTMVGEIYSSIDQQYVVEADMLVQGGYSIEQHLNNSTLKQVLAESTYAVVILQDFGGWPLCSTNIDACSSSTNPLSNAVELVKSFDANLIVTRPEYQGYKIVKCGLWTPRFVNLIKGNLKDKN